MESPKSLLFKRQGTQQYMAREQFTQKTYSPFKVDIFAMGVILFKMIYKVYPPTQVEIKKVSAS